MRRLRFHPRPAAVLAAVFAAALGLAWPDGAARALLKVDFEQAYYVHPWMQVWDFSLVRTDGQYHLFYHGIPESQPLPAAADTIWHATSPDLVHWQLLGPAVSVSADSFESVANWAPDVFYSAENGLWWMAYTGVDVNYNQRGAIAWSRDLDTWYKSRLNPVLVPDPAVFAWNPDEQFGDFRDPFVYFRDGVWHLLLTARAAYALGGQGAIGHATSTDLLHWQDQSLFFRNDGTNPHNVMESVQYHVIDDVHHLFFLEYSVDGVSHIAADAPENFTFANRAFIDLGAAPEVDRFSPDGPWLFSRIGPYQETGHDALSWVVRTDTLRFQPGAPHPTVHKPHPLLRDFSSRSGNATLGNPCFGDNPARRGGEPAGVVGNFYFGSKEYYQGPLSGRGAPGAFLGDQATGEAIGYDFVVEGHSLRMLVGGGEYPETCYIALCDAEADTVLLKETGRNEERMTWRYWDLRPYVGRQVYLKIVDAESGAFGRINVDEIEELAADPPPGAKRR